MHTRAHTDNITCLAGYHEHLCPPVPYILSKCIWNVTSIKLLDTKVVESQPRGTNLRHCERCGTRKDPPRRKGKLMPIIVSRCETHRWRNKLKKNFRQIRTNKYISKYIVHSDYQNCNLQDVSSGSVE